MKVLDGGSLSLVSNGGLYASHPDAALNWQEGRRPAGRRAGRGAPGSPMNTSTQGHDPPAAAAAPASGHRAVGVRCFPQAWPPPPRAQAAELHAGGVGAVRGAALVMVARAEPPDPAAACAGRTMTGPGQRQRRPERPPGRARQRRAGVDRRRLQRFVAKIQHVLAARAHSSDSVAVASQRNPPGQRRPVGPHRTAGRRAGRNGGFDGRTDGHGQAERRQCAQARQLAGVASEVATRGGAVVAKVVETMAFDQRVVEQKWSTSSASSTASPSRPISWR
jgi:methyl-accepting chemotaxis protein